MRELSTVEVSVVSGGSDLDTIANGLHYISTDDLPAGGVVVYMQAQTSIALASYMQSLDNAITNYYPTWAIQSSVNPSVPTGTVTAVATLTNSSTGTVTTKRFSFAAPTKPGSQPSY